MSAAAETGRRRILPRDAAAAPLDVVIGVMAFLAGLSLGGVLVAHRTAENWQAGLVNRLTVQILPEGGAAPETEVNAALALLSATPGVRSAAALSDRDNLALVEPWLGREASLADLPFPRMIDVQLVPGAALDVADLGRRLKATAPHSILDDHERWIGRLRSVANSVVYSALAVLVLIAVATAATVAFATRAGLAAHHEIVELLHLMGARDRFVARAFEWHYFLGAAIAGIAGAAAAALVLVAASGAEQLGLAAGSFLPPLGLRLDELPWLLLIPVAAAAIAWATARASVISALGKFY